MIVIPLFEFNKSYRSASPIIRGGMVSGGVMAKAIGRTSTYGTPQNVEVNHLVRYFKHIIH
jgi:hypothetical protein